MIVYIITHIDTIPYCILVCYINRTHSVAPLYDLTTKMVSGARVIIMTTDDNSNTPVTMNKIQVYCPTLYIYIYM